jgi:hypothetical protein
MEKTVKQKRKESLIYALVYIVAIAIYASVL